MSLLSEIAIAIKTKLGGTSINNTIPRYDGTACKLKKSDVTISDTNVVTAGGGFVGNLTGTASNATLAESATKLATARTIALSGDVTGSVSFDGSANVSITATVADDSHNHVISNVDGLQEALDLKAPLDSPVFTGTPRIGTDNITSISTSVENNAVARYDGTTGKLQDSLIKITDDNRLVRYAIGTSDVIPINSGVFAGVKPQIQIYTNSDGNAGQLLHIGNLPTDSSSAFTRRAGARFSLSYESSAGESSKSASIYVESTSTYSNNPSLKFEVLNTEKASLDHNGNLLLTSGTGTLGYGTGAGGTVTQLTSKSTDVTLNKPSGRIVMHNASLAAGAIVSFNLNNTLITSYSTINIHVAGSTNVNIYVVENIKIANSGGKVLITIKNVSGTSLAENVNLNFNIIVGSDS